MSCDENVCRYKVGSILISLHWYELVNPLLDLGIVMHNEFVRFLFATEIYV